jgi:hypothetical protein
MRRLPRAADSDVERLGQTEEFRVEVERLAGEAPPPVAAELRAIVQRVKE